MKRIYLLRRNMITFTSADPIHTLHKLNEKGVVLFKVSYSDDFTVNLETKGHLDRSAIDVLERYTNTFQIKNGNTMWSRVLLLVNRPIFLIGFAVLLFLTLYLPTRVLFVEVKGNETTANSLIKSAANASGIHFGVSRKEVRSVKVKNRMISLLPQLEWVGVNTRGCVAEITVREGVGDKQELQNNNVGNIVASRDGIILSCTTLRGTQLCKPGQAVRRGQLLVSGYTDCGIYIQGTLAKADILASTKRELVLAVPNSAQKRQTVTREERRLRLIIGNNLINFYNDSGISPTTCVKIYKEYPLELPGGFTLPISFITENIVYYESVLADTDTYWAKDSGQDYLQTQMIAGTIISKDVQIIPYNAVTYYKEKYFCTEMIGKIKFEETLKTNGYNGKNGKCRTR